MRRIISVWLPDWATDRLRRGSPGSAPPAEAPLVTCRHDGRRLILAAADAAARQLGLHADMPLAHARALVPGLTVMEADPSGDAAALADLAAWCLRYAPLSAADMADGIWIDATGCAHLHGGEAMLLANLTGRLARAGVTARTAIADTPGAAWALARHGTPSCSVVAPGAQAAALAMLPLAALRIAPEAVRGLRRLGIEHVAALAAMPRGPLVRRFGTAVLTRLDQALGRVAEPIMPVCPPEAVAHRLAFIEPLSTAAAFGVAIDVLLRAVCARLAATGQGARRIDLVFERADGSAQAIAAGTVRPVRDAAHLARLFAERIGGIDPGAGVEAMRLVATHAEALPATQLAAEPGKAADNTALGALLDVLENRFGAAHVYRCQPVQSDVPERSVRRVPALVAPAGAGWPKELPRPVRLLHPPRRIEALSLLPDQPPVAFTWRRQRLRIRRADGPERIAGEWWRRDAETSAVRDYWAVEDEAGRRYWLFRRGDGTDPASGDLSWYLHGFF
ncbi:MAG: DNA polymerase Y family protein [Rhodospirillales bacterium]|nr:DNA polymerase Y family protein [Rhodospirillales bacterium]